ncbi:MAG: hypothetical protein EPN22_04545 [Nitrospirae bacterium]|nr:MAG: hypothetical protein EPN22_04545 [Nitrospirota bacterium]
MSPDVFLQGFSIFMVCLAVHIIVWRVRIPRNDISVLFFIFLVVPVLGLTGTAAVMCWRGVTNSLVEMLEVLILHISLASAYIATYPAAQASSPSLDILISIATSMNKRLTEDDIAAKYNDITLVKSRIEDLRGMMFVSQVGDNIVLTATGEVLICLFILYRRMIGLPLGEG